MPALRAFTLAVTALLLAPPNGHATEGKPFKLSPGDKASLGVQTKNQPRVVSVIASKSHPGTHEWVTFTVNRTAPCSIAIYVDGAMSGWQPANSATTTFKHQFTTGGVHKVVVKGYPTDPGPSCADEVQTSVTVKSTYAQGLVKPPHTIVSTRSPCPPGSRLKHQNRASGAFSCVLDKSKKPECPPGTIYYETDCEFGCREYLR